MPLAVWRSLKWSSFSHLRVQMQIRACIENSTSAIVFIIKSLAQIPIGKSTPKHNARWRVRKSSHAVVMPLSWTASVQGSTSPGTDPDTGWRDIAKDLEKRSENSPEENSVFSQTQNKMPAGDSHWSHWPISQSLLLPLCFVMTTVLWTLLQPCSKMAQAPERRWKWLPLITGQHFSECSAKRLWWNGRQWASSRKQSHVLQKGDGVAVGLHNSSQGPTFSSCFINGLPSTSEVGYFVDGCSVFNSTRNSSKNEVSPSASTILVQERRYRLIGEKHH